jgi:hypothetical protein
MEVERACNLVPLEVIVMECCRSISVYNLVLLEEECCIRALQSARRIWKQACPKLLHPLRAITWPYDFTALCKGSRPDSSAV